MRGIDPARLERELGRLRESWRRFWPGLDTAAMATDVEERARAAIDDWRLADLELLGGGRVALVCGAMRTGRPVAIKVRPRGHGEERAMAGEGAALAAWAGSGAAVPLLEIRDEGLTLLLERLLPGDSLEESTIESRGRLRVLGEVAARLHAAAPAEPVGVIGLAEYCAPWRRDLADRPEDLAGLDALLASGEDESVLHGDLHGGNVLLHEGRWLAIDPHAAYGDRSAEIWPLINPTSPVLASDPEGMRAAVREFASIAGLDPARAARWARLRAIAEAEYVDGGENPADEERTWAVKLRRFAAASALPGS